MWSLVDLGDTLPLEQGTKECTTFAERELLDARELEVEVLPEQALYCGIGNKKNI
jgi:hypothetical protein